MHYLDVEAVGVECSLGWKLHCLGFCMGIVWVGQAHTYHRFDVSDSAPASLQPWESRATHLLTDDMFREVTRKTVGRLALAGIHPTSLHLFH